MAAPRPGDFPASQPGAAPYGNFPNYSRFHPPEGRLRLLPGGLLRSLFPAASRPLLGLDVGCNSGELSVALYRHLLGLEDTGAAPAAGGGEEPHPAARAGEEPPGAGEQHPAAGGGGEEPPVAGEEPPVAGEKPPASGGEEQHPRAGRGQEPSGAGEEQHPTAGEEPPGAGEEPPTAGAGGEEPPTAGGGGEEPPGAGEEPPTAGAGGEEPPTAREEPPGAGEEPPTAGAGGEEPPTAREEPPGAGEEPPTAGAGGEEPPTAREEPPGAGEEPPTAGAGGEEPPTAREEPPGAGEAAPPCGEQLQLLCCDIDAGLIARARSRSPFPASISFARLDIMDPSSRDPSLSSYLARFGRPRFDLVFCMSVTMWIHLNHGDGGLLAFLSCLSSLGRYLLLEPQPWRCYRAAARRLRKLGRGDFEHFRSLSIQGDMAEEISRILTRDCSMELVCCFGSTSWDRRILLFKSTAPGREGGAEGEES